MRLALFLTSLLFFAPIAAQNGVISADELNVLYVGLENPISIAIPGVSVDKTVVKTTVGTIVKRDSQYLVLIPKRTANQVLITIGKLKRKDTVWVFTKRFRVRNV